LLKTLPFLAYSLREADIAPASVMYFQEHLFVELSKSTARPPTHSSKKQQDNGLQTSHQLISRSASLQVRMTPISQLLYWSVAVVCTLLCYSSCN